MHDNRGGKLIFFSASLQFAATRRKDVLHPLRLAAVRETDDKSLRLSKNIHWRPVDSPRLPTYMRKNAEARKPACE